MRLAAPRIAPSVARFNPSGRLGELFGNLTQKLRRSLFRFGRDILFYKTLHAREFFVNSLAKIFEVSDALKPPEFFVDALAEIFEFVHKCQFSSLRPAHRVPIIPKSPRFFSAWRFFARTWHVWTTAKISASSSTKNSGGLRASETSKILASELTKNSRA